MLRATSIWSVNRGDEKSSLRQMTVAGRNGAGGIERLNVNCAEVVRKFVPEFSCRLRLRHIGSTGEFSRFLSFCPLKTNVRVAVALCLCLFVSLTVSLSVSLYLGLCLSVSLC